MIKCVCEYDETAFPLNLMFYVVSCSFYPCLPPYFMLYTIYTLYLIIVILHFINTIILIGKTAV